MPPLCLSSHAVGASVFVIFVHQSDSKAALVWATGSEANSRFSLSPVRVRDYGPVKDTGWHNSINQNGLGRTAHKIPQRWTMRKLRVQHATNCHCGRTLNEKIVKISSQRVDGRPLFLWGLHAKFDSQFVKGFQETDLAGHLSGERAIRCASRNFDRKSLPSQPSIGNKVFAIANLWFICTIMSRQLRASWIRTHPTIDQNLRLCMTPSFCKQPFVNGKVASPKSIAGDTTASNNFSRKAKETCLFNNICLYLWNLFQATCRISPGQKIAT